MKKILVLALLLIINPFIINAYSDYIYAGGETIGIELNSNYILVAGTYSVNNKNYSFESGLRAGDKLIAVDGKAVKSIKELTNETKSKETVVITYIRDNKEKKTTLPIIYDDGIYKTGLYVKDSIMGIGTLTFVDPNSKIYGCLGHEITEKITKEIFETESGAIFSSNVTNIVKSKSGKPGEKIAEFNTQDVLGTIKENTKKGVFGEYASDISDRKLYKVASKNEIKTGKAQILTVLAGNKVQAFDVNILKISPKSATRNILFEIKDKDLIATSNGIVQGMSGSPIIQGDYIIGAVTHVVIDKPNKGYGIFITNMLEESEN